MKMIVLTRGKYALVDDDNYEWINQWKWCAAKWGNSYYAIRALRENGKQETVYMHRVILRAQHKHHCDHIDGDGLNNTVSNLRLCSRAENYINRRKYISNTSGYKGVSWYKPDSKWLARIGVGGKRIFLGYYDDKVDAARAYNDAAKNYHGKFAHLNTI